MVGRPLPALSTAWLYVALTAIFSAAFYALVITSGHLSGGGGTYVAGLMWCPAIAAVVTSFLSGHKLSGFSWPGTRWMLLAVAMPLAYALAAYLIIWGSGAGGFPSPQFILAKREALGLPGLNDATVLILWFVLLGSAGIVQATARALGEEIGWRGFLTPLLADRLGFAGAVLVTATVWTLWHIPILVFADYHSSSPLPVAIVSFTLMIFAMSVILAWLRIRSASVWPCAVMHAAHNAFIQGFFTPATAESGPWTNWLIDEFGLATPITIAVFACAIVVADRRMK